ncbi:MAG: hypothetical protein QM572_05310, partial [Nocardioides sp.]|uniref:hypothetical protein n=1 Tax=Nocardioides sp. TaxID=35761 RepID=UPI0039E290B3
MRPARPVLRPGFAPVRHDGAHLQIGHLAPTRAVLPDHAEVRRLLDALSDPDALWEEPTAPHAVRALRRLAAAGLAVPAPRRLLE